MLCLALAHWQLPGSAKRIDTSSHLSLWSFDYFGLGSFFISVTSFILATTDGGIIFESSTPAILTVSCAFLVILVLIECLGTKHPIIPPSVVAAPGLSGIFVGQIIFFASISTVSAYLLCWPTERCHANADQILNNLPPYLSQINHLSNSGIAMRIWPSGLGLILGAVIAGKAMSK